METENRRVLQFRCANTGRRFVVIFSRSNPNERFHVVNAIDEKDLTGQEMPMPGWKPASTGPVDSAPQIGTHVAGLLSGAKRFLQILRAQGTKTNIQKATPKEQPPGAKGRPVSDFDSAEFDFKGWYCPCCGYGRKPVQVQFVRCGRCREYICGGRISRLADGSLQFKCHEKCGNSGILGKGTISSISGINFDVNKPSELPGSSSKLVQPAPRQLKSGKDNK